MNRKSVLAFGLAGAAFAAAAQTGTPAPPPPPDKGAMERALQQADGPRRRILEAARANAGAKPATEAPAHQPPLAPRPVAAAASAPRPARAEEAPATPITVIVTMPVAVEPVALPEGTKVDEVPAVAAPERIATPSSLVELAPAPEAAASAPAEAASAPAALAAGAPRLLSRVDPELSPRVLRRVLPRTEVQVSLTINPDGSVRDVVVQPTRNADLDAAVADAVRQWRYEAQPAARPHQVVLVVSPS